VLLGEHRAAWALVHEAVWGDGDNEDVALPFGLNEVTQVPGVKKVEDAMTLNDNFLLVAVLLKLLCDGR